MAIPVWQYLDGVQVWVYFTCMDNGILTLAVDLCVHTGC